MLLWISAALSHIHPIIKHTKCTSFLYLSPSGKGFRYQTWDKDIFKGQVISYSTMVSRSYTNIYHKMMSPETRPSHTRQGHVQPYTAQASLHVPLQKFAVEITSDGVVNEPFWSLSFSACLVLEYHIIIPPTNHTCQSKIRLTRSCLRISITWHGITQEANHQHLTFS